MTDYTELGKKLEQAAMIHVDYDPATRPLEHLCWQALVAIVELNIEKKNLAIELDKVIKLATWHVNESKRLQEALDEATR